MAGRSHAAFGSASSARMLSPWTCFGVGMPHRSVSVG